METHSQDDCPHSGFYSGVGIYSHELQRLRYVLICDGCGEEMQEVLAEDYAPDPVFKTAA
jgi:hypothetical protein